MHDYFSGAGGNKWAQLLMSKVKSFSYEFSDNRVFCIINMHNGLVHRSHGVNHENLSSAMDMAAVCALSMMESATRDGKKWFNDDHISDHCSVTLESCRNRFTDKHLPNGSVIAPLAFKGGFKFNPDGTVVKSGKRPGIEVSGFVINADQFTISNVAR